MFVVIFVILIGIRFHDDMAAIKIFETTLESGERMLKFFLDSSTTKLLQLLAFLLEGDNFSGAFDAEVLKAYVRSRFDGGLY